MAFRTRQQNCKQAAESLWSNVARALLECCAPTQPPRALLPFWAPFAASLQARQPTRPHNHDQQQSVRPVLREGYLWTVGEVTVLIDWQCGLPIVRQRFESGDAE